MTRSPLAAFVELVADLCRLRRGPADAPYSPPLLGLLVGASVLVDVGSGALAGGAANMLARSLTSTALLLGLCWIALRIRGLVNRYVQTATALVACGIVFTLLALPIAWLFGAPPADAQHMTPTQVLLGWAVLAVLVWNLAVNAHILRHAMDAPFPFGFALASTWAVADVAIGYVLFGGAR